MKKTEEDEFEVELDDVTEAFFQFVELKEAFLEGRIVKGKEVEALERMERTRTILLSYMGVATA